MKNQIKISKEDYKNLIFIPRLKRLISLSNDSRNNLDFKNNREIRNRADKLIHEMVNTYNILSDFKSI